MRIRSIKPELWTDAVSGEWGSTLTLFFVGLWQVADDSGRLRLDPRLIRADLDPFDTKFGGTEGISGLLKEIIRAGRVLVYEAEGQRLGLVRGFAVHQVINKPTRSRLPPPPEGLREASGSPPVAVPPKDGVEGSMELGAGSREGSMELGEADEPSGSGSASAADQVIASWNDLATGTGLPKCRGSDALRKKIRTRLKSPGWRDALPAALRFLEASDFHRGNGSSGWKADLAWLLKPGKVEELADKGTATATRSPTSGNGPVPAASAEDFADEKSGGFGS